MKKLSLYVLLLLSFIFVWIYFNKTQSKVAGVSTENSLKKLSVEQKINSIAKSYVVNNGQTALDLLKANTSVIIKGTGQNTFVTSIDKKEASEKNKEYWAFYVNGKLAVVGAGSYKLKDGDKIEWKIERY